MSSVINTLFAYAYATMRKMERGDADSSSSTLRVFGVVAIVLAVLLTVGGVLMLVFPTLGAALTAGQTAIAAWFNAIP